MNITVLSILLFVHLSLFAQNNPDEVYARSRDQANVSRTATARYANSSRESSAATEKALAHRLDIILDSHKSAATSQQPALRQEARNVLMQMMEMRLQETEQEIQVLISELNQLKASKVYGDQHAHMLELQSRISSVRGRLEKRRSLMSDIVEKRLNEIIK